ncbi:hypothetical protein OSB04_015590 [Centaurea solstitialis]|uniref:TRAPPC10/Trs130 N-terminal domain-containing protein n=1 Tax=Centaurea solstitialis TaxID=347529 RepID=A0AA38TBB2_9ASTR|nr:hypothetical protein OSB04_015590 [Centaurea solstitialis]
MKSQKFQIYLIPVEDVSDLWPLIKKGFDERLPFRRATLNNKTRNPVSVANLPAEFILTTDSRLRSRFPQEQLLFSFREPYATVVLVTCEDLEEFKTILKPRLKLIVQNDEREWFIVFVSRAPPHNDQATKMAKKVYAKLEVDFSSKKRERCCKLDIHGPEASFWEDLESKITECIRNTLDRRIQFYEEEIRKLSEQRFKPVWSFCNFFILKESLAFMFEMAHLHEDSLREYDELELCYLETVNIAGKQRDFGGMEHGDDQAALLNPGKKPLTQIVQDDSFREFEFRQYLFACQAKCNLLNRIISTMLPLMGKPLQLLFKLNRPFEVASRGFSFVISFSKALALHERFLPFCLREVWIITSCLDLVNATAAHYTNGLVGPEIEKEYYRVRGELYSLCRAKFMRLAYLVGYGSAIERSPVNSASLSMLPWPKPAVWPSLPSDASSEVLAKEKMILQATERVRHFGIQRKLLPLEPTSLLREANRRRASLSAGNVFELFDGRSTFMDGSGSTSPSPKLPPISMPRTNSTPGNFESSIDRPMTLTEIFVAAEHALQKTISDSGLWTSFSSLEEFEKKYLELSKAAADNYHHSWWKRHGVVLDGEIAALCFKHGNHDLAAKSYEKVCALYSGEEVVRLAHSEMEHPVPLDVSSLITFSGNSGPPLELCDGDPGILSVTLWSGFPDDITLESLSLTLIATSNADEGVKAIRSSGATILNPGRNTITLSLPPQKTGSYVLGVLTGQIGHLRFRSHGSARGGPAESDDLMSYEKPTRPILKVVFKPRSLVDLAAAVSSALLMNEPQWVGIIVKPLNYSLKGAVLHIDTGPGLRIEESHAIEMETYTNTSKNADGLEDRDGDRNSTSVVKEFTQLTLKDGSIELPDWASHIVSVLWIPVCAINDSLARGTSTGTVSSQRPSVVDGLRTVALKLEFGVSHNQIFERFDCPFLPFQIPLQFARPNVLISFIPLATTGRTIAVHFTNPFHVSTRVADKCGDGTLLLQAILHSQVKAPLTIHDAWLDLQDGFAHGGRGDGRPASAFFPLVVPSASRAGILFSISLGTTTSEDEAKVLNPDTILNIRYTISGERSLGSHTPMSVGSNGAKDDATQLLTFRSALVLQRPVLEPCLAVGFLPLPSGGLRVGQLFTMKWRVERLKYLDEENKDEVLYEVNANSENWMIAGRKRGHVPLSAKQGIIYLSGRSLNESHKYFENLETNYFLVKNRDFNTMLPLAAGYVRPPQLELPNIGDANISCNPAGPHLVCVFPPPLSSSFCIPA